MSITKETLEQKLIAELQATHVEITDTSGGCGAMFEAVIVSPLFAGKPLLARHRFVSFFCSDLNSVPILDI